MVIDGGKDAETIVNCVDTANLERTASAMANGTTGGSQASRLYLNKVKAVANSLPHTNEYAGKASMKMESMHHSLGAPHIFLQ